MSILKRVEPKRGVVVSIMDDLEAEKRGDTTVTMPFRLISRAVGGGLKKGFTSVLAGPPGNGKSYFAYRMLLWCIDRGINAKYLPLEYEAKDHIRRCFAVDIKSWGMVEDGQSTADNRIKMMLENIDSLKKIEKIEKCVLENPCKITVDKWGEPVIPEAPYSEIMEVYKHYAKDTDLFIIDPITAIDVDENGGHEFKQQERFIKMVGAVSKHNNCHAMLVSHTRKRQKHNGIETKLTMDDIAGAAAVSRFAQYLFLLDFHEKEDSKVMRSMNLEEETEHTRTMVIGKTNFGCGKGQKYAFDFGKGGPKMEELGLITGKVEKFNA